MPADQKQHIAIQLFGAFRRIYDQPVTLSVSVNATANEVKSELGNALQQLNPAFNDQDLLAKSVLADNQKIFASDEAIGACATLAILPPVCGG